MDIKIPVTWEVCGYVYIDADTIEEAMEKFDETCDEIPLPEGGYVDGSFQITCREKEYIQYLNPDCPSDNNEEETNE